MENNNIKFVSADSISADLFNGYGYVAVITDGDYDELKNISGEYRTQVFHYDDRYTANADLLVALGGEQALAKAKELSDKTHTELILIPTVPTHEAVTELYIDSNCTVKKMTDAYTLLAVKPLINNQPRELLSDGLGSIAGLITILFDEAVVSFVSGNDIKGETLLKKIVETLGSLDKFASPYPNIGFDLLDKAYNLSASRTTNIYEPFIATRLYSLFNSGKIKANNCKFQLSYAILSLYSGFSPQKELIVPPDRNAVMSKIIALLPNACLSSDIYQDTFALTRYVLNDRFEQLHHSLSRLSDLAKVYFRLNGYSGYYIRSLCSVNDILSILPITAELSESNTLLKHIYASGYLNQQ